MDFQYNTKYFVHFSKLGTRGEDKIGGTAVLLRPAPCPYRVDIARHTDFDDGTKPIEQVRTGNSLPRGLTAWIDESRDTMQGPILWTLLWLHRFGDASMLREWYAKIRLFGMRLAFQVTPLVACWCDACRPTSTSTSSRPNAIEACG